MGTAISSSKTTPHNTPIRLQYTYSMYVCMYACAVPLIRRAASSHGSFIRGGQTLHNAFIDRRWPDWTIDHGYLIITSKYFVSYYSIPIPCTAGGACLSIAKYALSFRYSRYSIVHVRKECSDAVVKISIICGSYREQFLQYWKWLRSMQWLDGAPSMWQGQTRAHIIPLFCLLDDGWVKGFQYMFCRTREHALEKSTAAANSGPEHSWRTWNTNPSLLPWQHQVCFAVYFCCARKPAPDKHPK